MTWPEITQPVLFIDTPRAGNLGHRYLVSTYCPLTEQQLAEISDAARRGNNYHVPMLVRKVPIRVTTASGVIRDSEEILIVYGINVHRLSKNLLGDLNILLDEFVLGLDNFICCTDWRNAQFQLVIDSATVSSWQTKIASLDLPLLAHAPPEKTFATSISVDRKVEPELVSVSNPSIIRRCVFVFVVILISAGSFFIGKYYDGIFEDSVVSNQKCINLGVEKSDNDDKIIDSEAQSISNRSKPIQLFGSIKSKKELGEFEEMQPNILHDKSVELAVFLTKTINESDLIDGEERKKMILLFKNIQNHQVSNNKVCEFGKKGLVESLKCLADNSKCSGDHQRQLMDNIQSKLKAVNVNLLISENNFRSKNSLILFDEKININVLDRKKIDVLFEISEKKYKAQLVFLPSD